MAFDNSSTVLISVQNTSPKRKRVNTEHGLAHEKLALSAKCVGGSCPSVGDTNSIYLGYSLACASGLY